MKVDNASRGHWSAIWNSCWSQTNLHQHPHRPFYTTTIPSMAMMVFVSEILHVSGNAIQHAAICYLECRSQTSWTRGGDALAEGSNQPKASRSAGRNMPVSGYSGALVGRKLGPSEPVRLL